MGIKNKKILIIEDELALARVLSLKITSAGYACEVANDGDSGFKLLSNNVYSLVLLDLILPGLDGFEILEKCKTLKHKSPIVILSNLNQGDDMKRAKDLGATDFFVKSDMQLSDIINYVKKLLP